MIKTWSALKGNLTSFARYGSPFPNKFPKTIACSRSKCLGVEISGWESIHNNPIFPL